MRSPSTELGSWLTLSNYWLPLVLLDPMLAPFSERMKGTELCPTSSLVLALGKKGSFSKFPKRDGHNPLYSFLSPNSFLSPSSSFFLTNDHCWKLRVFRLEWQAPGCLLPLEFVSTDSNSCCKNRVGDFFESLRVLALTCFITCHLLESSFLEKPLLLIWIPKNQRRDHFPL